MNTTRREQWDGDPIELGDTWTLRNGERVAQRGLVTHPLSWNLSLRTDFVTAAGRSIKTKCRCDIDESVSMIAEALKSSRRHRRF
jgi:hypothetical protein